MELSLYLGILLAIFLASVVHGLTGFGFAMVLVIILPHIGVNYFNMLSIISLFSILITLIYAIVYRKHFKWSWMPPIIISCVLFDFLAVNLLAHYRDLNWSRYLGVFLILLTLYFVFWQNKIKIKANTRNGFITGATGGFLEGLFGIGGPPAVIYFLAIAKDDKYAYLGTMQLYFVILCVFDLAFRIKLDLITLNLSSFLIPGLICILLGVFVGYKLVKLISPKQMKYAVYTLLFLNGFLLVLQ